MALAVGLSLGQVSLVPLVRLDPFDRSLGLRTTGATVASVAVAVGVVITTDEVTSTASMRVARLVALSPAVIAIAVLGVVAAARARGELRALSALGSPSWSAARGAVWSGWVWGAMAIGLLASPWADPSSLFPVMGATVDWTLDADWAVARAVGVVVARDGGLRVTGSALGVQAVVPGAGVALSIVGPAAILCPVWAASALSLRVRIASAVGAVASAVTLFHLLAIGRVPPLVGILASAPLLAAAWLGHRRG